MESVQLHITLRKGSQVRMCYSYAQTLIVQP
jgi:hypothetical protein